MWSLVTDLDSKCGCHMIGTTLSINYAERLLECQKLCLLTAKMSGSVSTHREGSQSMIANLV
jgi:hypothetical protein